MTTQELSGTRITASFVIPNECEKSRFMLRISKCHFFLSGYEYRKGLSLIIYIM